MSRRHCIVLFGLRAADILGSIVSCIVVAVAVVMWAVCVRIEFRLNWGSIGHVGEDFTPPCRF